MKIVKASKIHQVDTRDVVCDKIKACISEISECDQNQEPWAKSSIADLAVILSDIQASKNL